MASVDEAMASFERNIESQTGLSVAAWAALARETGLERHGQLVSWLKSEKALSHGVANHIAKRALAAPASAGDPVDILFAGGKEALRPLYDRLAKDLCALGDDVALIPKKANVSVRRTKQFALIQPSTRTRLDLGLILKDRLAAGRLEPSGGFNAMFTHRVKLARVEDVDAELLTWIKDAYDRAA